MAAIEAKFENWMVRKMQCAHEKNGVPNGHRQGTALAVP
jgi:hypothetical protein